MRCNEHSPRVSVIMGAYNVESQKVFSAAVNSILQQTMGEFEFIICDDGSTDYTWHLLSKLSQQDKRIRVMRNQDNTGLAASLNNCLKFARGDYIARQDADDVSDSERFCMQVRFLDEHPEIGFVGSNVDLLDEQGYWGERIFPTFPQPEDFLFTMPFVHGALMFRREAIERVRGYRIAKETRRTEDYDMLMRMYAAGIRGANLSEKLYSFMENQAAQKRRKYCYRLDEVVIRWKGFSSLGLMPKAVPFVVKPLVVGLIPQPLLHRLKGMRTF